MQIALFQSRCRVIGRMKDSLDRKILGITALLAISLLSNPNLCFANSVDQMNPAPIGANPQLQSTIEKKALIIKSESQPQDVNVPLVFKYPISSGQLRAGDAVQVEAAQDVYLGNTLVFKKGTEGIITIKKVRGSGIFGRGGSICLGEGQMTDELGVQHTLQVTKHSEKIKGNSMLAPKLLPILGYFYPPLALLSFYSLKKGDDAVIPPGKIFFAVTPAVETENVSLAKFNINK